jgi:hypothetical protein
MTVKMLHTPEMGPDLGKVQEALERFMKLRPEQVEEMNNWVPLPQMWQRIWRSAWLKGLYAGRREQGEQLKTIISESIDKSMGDHPNPYDQNLIMDIREAIIRAMGK